MRIFLDYAHTASILLLPMGRLNIYVPDEVHRLAARWRGAINLSEVCARALREELQAAESGRAAGRLAGVLRSASARERGVARRFRLADVVICDEPTVDADRRDVLGQSAADYVDRVLSDGALMAVCGGRQMWSVVRNVSPRSVRVTMTASGFGQSDPTVLHAHPNTLVTLLWLLFSPKAQAHLVGARAAAKLWNAALARKEGDTVQLVVLASCASFDASSPLAGLLEREDAAELARRKADADFAYTFLSKSGSIVPFAPSGPHFVLDAETLRRLSARRDARVVLVAGGRDKERVMRAVLEHRLCNTLITDAATAQRLT